MNNKMKLTLYHLKHYVQLLTLPSRTSFIVHSFQYCDKRKILIKITESHFNIKLFKHKYKNLLFGECS